MSRTQPSKTFERNAVFDLRTCTPVCVAASGIQDAGRKLNAIVQLVPDGRKFASK